MNIAQLECFLCVANTLNFARAAEQLNISQPAVTHQIQALENELNAKLFRRSTRSVELTLEGRAFLPDARSMVETAQRAKLRFSQPETAEIQTLSIGCCSRSHLFLLTEPLSQLAREYPNLHPILHVVPYRQLFAQIQNDAMDVIFWVKEDTTQKGSVQFRELAKSPIVCICRPDKAFSSEKTVTMEELRQEDLIFYDPLTMVPEASQMQAQLSGGKSPAHLHFCESAEAAMTLTEAGYGISVLPELFLPPEHSLKTLRVENAPVMSFGLCYKSLQGNPVLKRFVRLMGEALKKG